MMMPTLYASILFRLANTSFYLEFGIQYCQACSSYYRRCRRDQVLNLQENTSLLASMARRMISGVISSSTSHSAAVDPSVQPELQCGCGLPAANRTAGTPRNYLRRFFSCPRGASFTRAKKQVQELQAQGNPNTIVTLAGNKADMVDARQVAAEEAKIYAQENGLFFMETSAKTAINVNDIFYEIAKRLLQGQPAPNPQAGMVLTQRPNESMVSSFSCS